MNPVQPQRIIRPEFDSLIGEITKAYTKPAAGKYRNSFLA